LAESYILQIYRETSAETKMKHHCFDTLDLPSRILYYTNITRDECRNKDEALLLRYFGFCRAESYILQI